MSKIDELLAQLPESVLEYGGSHGGKLYQDEWWGEGRTFPAYRTNTRDRAEFLDRAIPRHLPSLYLLDVGCANGALTRAMSYGLQCTGWDINPVEIQIAIESSKHLWYPPNFEVHDIALDTPDRRYDVILYLSVWKWVVRRHGLEAANQTIVKLANHCSVLLFESGITDSGIDLGVGVTRADFHTLLPALLPNCKVELVGQFPRDEQNVDRDLWRITWP